MTRFYTSELTKEKVLAIIADLRTSMTYKQIGYKHNVSSRTVRNINVGVSYYRYTDGMRIRAGRGVPRENEKNT